ncbi:uncharacterized protein [Nicotiana sylvestris]|uniref:uncharacterized protein n=1 Tax=Nicotiana sylvestris TaxID=4096 RepID=UPI00388C642E
MVKEYPNNNMTESMIQQTFYRGINTTNQCKVNQLTEGNFMNMPYAEASEILDEMEDTSSVWQSRANVPQGDPNVIHLYKELYNHGQAIAELTNTMNQLAKAHLQQVQGPKQVHAVEGLNMMVNKRRQQGQLMESRPDQFMQDDSGYDQGNAFNEQDEEVQYVNKYQDESEEEMQEEMNPSREHVIDMPELSLSINVLLVEALEKISGYAKFMKDLVTKKRSMNCETIKMTHQGKYQLDALLGVLNFGNWATKPLGIIDDVFVRVDKFILPTDFVVLDCEVDYEVPIILGRPFLATGKALVDVEADELTFWVGDEKVVFHVCKTISQPNINEVYLFVDLVTDVIVDDASATMNVEDKLEAVLLNLDDDEKSDGYAECVNALQGRVHIIGATKEEKSNQMDFGRYPGHKPRLLHEQDCFGGG